LRRRSWPPKIQRRASRVRPDIARTVLSATWERTPRGRENIPARLAQPLLGGHKIVRTDVCHRLLRPALRTRTPTPTPRSRVRCPFASKATRIPVVVTNRWDRTAGQSREWRATNSPHMWPWAVRRVRGGIVNTQPRGSDCAFDADHSPRIASSLRRHREHVASRASPDLDKCLAICRIHDLPACRSRGRGRTHHEEMPESAARCGVNS